MRLNVLGRIGFNLSSKAHATGRKKHGTAIRAFLSFRKINLPRNTKTIIQPAELFAEAVIP